MEIVGNGKYPSRLYIAEIFKKISAKRFGTNSTTDFSGRGLKNVRLIEEVDYGKEFHSLDDSSSNTLQRRLQ